MVLWSQFLLDIHLRPVPMRSDRHNGDTINAGKYSVLPLPPLHAFRLFTPSHGEHEHTSKSVFGGGCIHICLLAVIMR